ncbi:MAG TPA: hypothetical protein VF982_01755 [Anaerolineales bacterium]|jgi:hypothetical protein
MIREPERKPPFFLLTGLVFGLLLGFLLTWLIWPPRVTEVGPASLAEPYRAQYRLMTALAFASTTDLGRAQARLELLGDSDPVRALNSQAQVALASNATQREARALASLAETLAVHLASQQATAQAVNTPNPGDDSASTPIESVGEGAAYFLDDQQLTCESADAPPYLKIFIFDTNHNPQAGVQLTLSSTEGEAQFTTGQRPEMSQGYAEYALTPGIAYTLYIEEVQMMSGLQAAACETEEGEPAWGSWLLLFNTEE